MRSLALVVIGSALGLSSVLVARQASPPQQTRPVFRSSTELVEVDVVVVDKAGNPVHGLTRDDFVVTDRKKPQSIETFQEIRREDESADVSTMPPATTHVDIASNTTARSGRLVVLLLDDLHIFRGRSDTAKMIARK